MIHRKCYFYLQSVLVNWKLDVHVHVFALKNKCEHIYLHSLTVLCDRKLFSERLTFGICLM